VSERSADDKISSSLRAVLAGLEPGQCARLVVILHLPGVRVRRGADRSAAIELKKAAAEPIVEQIDDVLTLHGGRRLPGEVGALGSTFVEATPNAARALAALDGVEAIIEDQAVYPAT
jgi:hypothetical protein